MENIANSHTHYISTFGANSNLDFFCVYMFMFKILKYQMINFIYLKGKNPLLYCSIELHNMSIKVLNFIRWYPYQIIEKRPDNETSLAVKFAW